MNKQELTPKQYLAVLNNHIDCAIKNKCGDNNNEERWGINEINSIINCIGTLTNVLTQYEELQKQHNIVKAELETMKEIKKEEEEMKKEGLKLPSKKSQRERNLEKA